MDVAESQAPSYRCPGENYDIDRAVHLGRLATFYPACRDCAHRGDACALSPLHVRQWAQLVHLRGQPPRFTSEGFTADSPNDFQPELVRRLVTALTLVAWRQSGGQRQPRILIGAVGHWSSAGPLSEAAGAVQLAGCQAIEVGAVTAPSMSALAQNLDSDAAIWLGNASGEPHAIGAKFWGRAGQPWSAPGSLEEVRENFELRVARPKRRGGSLDRAAGRDTYLQELAPLYHALRPLRFALDTMCAPLRRYFEELSAASACEALQLSSVSRVAPDDAERRMPFVSRRLKLIAEQVLATDAHFGVWISGDGEACHLVDERGAIVDSHALFLLLANFMVAQQPTAALVLEGGASREIESVVKNLGARVVPGGTTRESMNNAIVDSGALFGGGASGRFWYANGRPAPDALLTLSLLLSILSQSDRSLGEVLDAARERV